MLKLRTLFSGLGAPEKALRNLDIDFETVDFCEFDKYAIKSYCAVHGEDESKNLGDITKVWGRGLAYADGMIWGFPCTDISIAGKMEGVIEGQTRSGLYYDGLRILHETKPAWSLIENVKNLTSKKFKPVFDSILRDLEDEGYNNYWKVLNAKDYGIPQNRERVFILSIRKELDNHSFEWPEPQELRLRLADLLEQEVDERYYISQEKTDKLLKTLDAEKLGCNPCITPDRVEKRQNGRRFKEDGEPMFTLTAQDKHGILQIGRLEDINGHDICKRVYSAEGCSPTLPTGSSGNTTPKVLVSEATKLGYAEATIGDSINIQQLGSATRRGRVGKEVCQTIDTSSTIATLTTEMRIRKLTPLETWLLMGFSKEDFNKARAAGISDSQLYKQAGNSIVVNVLMAIFKQMQKAGIIDG